MKSVLRFVVFVAVLASAVGLLYFWKTGKPAAPTGHARPFLEKLDRDFTSLIGQVLPSVVSINALPSNVDNPRMQLLHRFFGTDPATPPPQMGSGIIVSDEGHIVTNYHVVAGAGKVEVCLNDGRVFPAQFLGADAPSDIAILKITADGIHPLAWGNSDTVQVGQMVFAVGNPLGLQETVTQGIISAKGRRAASEAANEFFQTDAPINRGNSGGPLVNLRGELIGVNNMVTLQAQGIAFAIPANTVRRVFESIRDHGRFIRPWFGAEMWPLTPQLVQQLGLQDDLGALVAHTYEGSPAEKAGIQPGDIIVELNGRPIRDHIDLRNRMAEAQIGQKMLVKIRRDGQLRELQVVTAPEPEN